MFRNNRPRYWVDWYDRWLLLLALLLLLLLCWFGYLATLPAPSVSLALAYPGAMFQADKPVQLQGTAPANLIVQIFDGGKLLGETRAGANGAFKYDLPNPSAGSLALQAFAQVNGARIPSPQLVITVSPPVAVAQPTVAPSATSMPPATATRPPTAVPTLAPTAASAPTVVPSPSPPMTGTVQRRGKDNAEMVFVPAGEFTMGSDSQSRVYLDAFWIDKSEVTNGLFQQFVDATSFKTDAEKTGWGFDYINAKWERVDAITWRAPRGTGTAVPDKKLPVVVVSWQDANAFCMWAAKRLPTEAEWEKSARGIDGRAYPWGNTWDGTKLNFCDVNCAYPWKDSGVNDGFAETAPVGSFPQGASPFGALDLAGNVWEWTSSWFDPNYAKTMPLRNPPGPAAGELKILRGGAWSIDQAYARTTSLFYEPPEFRHRSVGFRCVQ